MAALRADVTRGAAFRCASAATVTRDEVLTIVMSDLESHLVTQTRTTTASNLEPLFKTFHKVQMTTGQQWAGSRVARVLIYRPSFLLRRVTIES